MLISKLNLFSIEKLPKIKRLAMFFIVNFKQYKKNLLLFYIIISLVFGGMTIMKTNIRNSMYIINLVIKKRKIFFFLQTFVNFYLPLLNHMDNTIKVASVHYNTDSAKLLTYRLNYFKFPVIPESDSLTENYELIYNFISNYKMQLDVVLTNSKLKCSNSFLLRMYRLPVKFQTKKLIK